MRWREKREWERKPFPQLDSSSREGTLSDVNMSTHRQECTRCTISSMNLVLWLGKKEEIGGYTICPPACVCIAYA